MCLECCRQTSSELRRTTVNRLLILYGQQQVVQAVDVPVFSQELSPDKVIGVNRRLLQGCANVLRAQGMLPCREKNALHRDEREDVLRIIDPCGADAARNTSVQQRWLWISLLSQERG